MSWRRYWHNDTNDSQCKIMNQKLRMDDEQIVPDIDRLRSTSMRAVRKFSCINQNESIRSSSSISSSTIRYDTDHSFQQSSSSSSPQQQQQQHQQHQNHLNFDTNLRSSSSSLSLSLERKFSDSSRSMSSYWERFNPPLQRSNDFWEEKYSRIAVITSTTSKLTPTQQMSKI